LSDSALRHKEDNLKAITSNYTFWPTKSTR
jgi:hypothetical protein